MYFLIQKIFAQIMLSIFPAFCVICFSKGLKYGLCNNCKNLLKTDQPVCIQCSNYLLAADNATICGACLKNPPYFDSTLSVGIYAAHLKKMITEFKFHEKLYLYRIFSHLLVEKIQQQSNPLPECIIPVALHRYRLQERGFNQALEIAKGVAKALNISIDYSCCKRIKYTLPQSSIPAKERQQNVKHAFILTREINYKHIAIIDDVVTTGSTVNELSRIFKKAGVKKIDIWCIART